MMLLYILSPLRLARPQCQSLRRFTTNLPRSAQRSKTKPATGTARSQVIPSPRQQRSAKPSATVPKQSNSVVMNPQGYRAKQLYDKGVREIYREGSKSRIIASWLIGGGLILNAVSIFSMRNWDSSKLVGMGGWQKMFVGGANRVAMFFLTAVGGFIIFRYLGSIRSIRLVDVGESRVKFDIRIRRRLPWSGTRYRVHPGDVLMPKNWRRSLPLPNERQRTPSLYAWMKSWMFMDGIISPVRLNKETVGFIDGEGVFGISLDDLGAMTSEKRF